MNETIAKRMSFAAVLLFAAATFWITSDRFLLGAVFFGAATCFACAAGKYQKKQKEQNERIETAAEAHNNREGHR